MVWNSTADAQEIRRRSTMHRNRQSAFTLIELLVVIAIIAIFAAILFPVFARAREQARKSVCSSNLRQVSMGLQMYMEDYDEHFPTLSRGCNYAVDKPFGDVHVAFYHWAVM